MLAEWLALGWITLRENQVVYDSDRKVVDSDGNEHRYVQLDRDHFAFLGADGLPGELCPVHPAPAPWCRPRSA